MHSAGVPEPGATVIPAMSGDAILQCRKRMGLQCQELALILGINKATLYRWEADGFFKLHNSPAARIMRWLLALSDAELAIISKTAKGYVAKGKDYSDPLYRKMLKNPKAARSPQERQ